MDPDGNVYVYRELYTTKRTYDELVSDIIALMDLEEEEIYAMVADPALQAKSPDTGVSFFDVAKKRKFNIIPGINDRVPGWNTLRAFLKVEEGERLG